MSDLPAGWAEAPLGDVCAVVSGSTPKSTEAAYWNGDIPWITPDDLSRHKEKYIGIGRRSISQAGLESCSARMVPAGTVLYTSRAPIGYVAIAERPVCTNQGFKSLVPPPEIGSDYLYWYMHYATAEVRTRASGTTFAEISGKAIKAVPLRLAPAAEQERIVATIEEQLSRLDAGAAALERVRQNIKRMRAAVLEAAVSGQLVSQDPTEGSGADVLARINIEPRRSKRKGAELVSPTPSVPAAWATAPWAAIGRSQNGRAFPSADYTTEGRRLLRPGNLHLSGQVVWSATNTRCLPEHYAVEFPDYLVGPHEIVMNLTAQSLRDEFLGRVCMTGQGEAALLNQRIARLTPVEMNARFVFWVLKSPLFRRFVAQLNTGSLIQHMFTSQLDQFIFPIPPRREQDRIVAGVEGLLSMLDALDRVAAHAQSREHPLRSSILDAAFSGELVRRDASDEPASVLLERIASERASSDGHKPLKVRSRRRTKVTT